MTHRYGECGRRSIALTATLLLAGPFAGRALAAPSCAASFAELVSSAEVRLIEGPIDGGADDDDEFFCGIWKASVRRPLPDRGPEDDESLDAAAMGTNILLVVRAPLGVAPCDVRWVTFDAGGNGEGYGPTFGRVPPGHYVAGGAGYGDDLIRSYNEAGFATVDLVWECSGLCSGTAFADWAPRYAMGSGWYHNLNGTGWVGAASRAREVYGWVRWNNGSQRLCGHAHSSGSGRLIAALTRFNQDFLFDTVVFDGGPVFAYLPWYCGFDEGPLGPRPDEFVLTAGDPFRYNCARSTGNNESVCDYDRCGGTMYDEQAFVADSSFLLASERYFPQTDVGIVLGGSDTSGAPEHVRLWLAGYGYDVYSIPGLEAQSLTLKQGICGDMDDEYQSKGGVRSCDDWNLDKFLGVTNAEIRGFDGRLVGTGHDTAATQGGKEVLQELMLATCEPF